MTREMPDPQRLGWRRNGPPERDHSFMVWCDSIEYGSAECPSEHDCDAAVCPAWRWYMTGEGTPPGATRGDGGDAAVSDADFYILHGHETFVGPCVHGRDPWTRCDECGEGNAVDALLKRTEKAESRLAETESSHLAHLREWQESHHAMLLRAEQAESRLAEITRALDRLAMRLDGFAVADGRACDDGTQAYGTRCHLAGRCYAWREAARDLRSLLGTHGGEGER